MCMLAVCVGACIGVNVASSLAPHTPIPSAPRRRGPVAPL